MYRPEISEQVQERSASYLDSIREFLNTCSKPKNLIIPLTELIPELLDRVTFTSDTLRKYFPRSYTPARMQETIIKLLEQWQRKRQRDQER